MKTRSILKQTVNFPLIPPDPGASLIARRLYCAFHKHANSKVHPGGKVLRDHVAKEVRAEPREETVHVVTQGIPDHTGSKEPPVHPVRTESVVSRGIQAPGVFRGLRENLENQFQYQRL